MFPKNFSSFLLSLLNFFPRTFAVSNWIKSCSNLLGGWLGNMFPESIPETSGYVLNIILHFRIVQSHFLNLLRQAWNPIPSYNWTLVAVHTLAWQVLRQKMIKIRKLKYLINAIQYLTLQRNGCTRFQKHDFADVKKYRSILKRFKLMINRIGWRNDNSLLIHKM